MGLPTPYFPGDCMFKVFSLCVFFILCACSSKKNLVAHGRDEAFYSQFVNTTEKIEIVEQSLENFKVLETGKEYPMRYVLFENHQFYYQIDRLGNGTGTWKFVNGALELTASRTFFDLNLVLSGEQAEGEGVVLRFVDRFGLQNITTQLLKPEQMEQPLPEFTESEKGI
jgi:hypothetical protein